MARWCSFHITWEVPPFAPATTNSLDNPPGLRLLYTTHWTHCAHSIHLVQGRIVKTFHQGNNADLPNLTATVSTSILTLPCSSLSNILFTCEFHCVRPSKHTSEMDMSGRFVPCSGFNDDHMNSLCPTFRCSFLRV